MFAHLGSRRGVVLTGTLIFTGLVFGCPITSVSAAPPKKQPKREPQVLSNAQLHQGLHVLQFTKKMLESANHDYGGHRVAAIKAVGAAEHQLKLALHSQTKKGSGGKAGAGRKPEPQNISNLQLADSIVILERTRTSLQKANHDYGGHRAAAVRDLGGAIQQLKTALKYEKKKR